MKQSLKLIGFAIMALSLTLSSCGKDGEDGEDGAMGLQGEQGIAGINGTNGTDGEDGENGIDGTNGTDGEDGEDGNANVTSTIYDLSSNSGTSYRIGTSSLTAENVENGVVLAYIRVSNEWYQVPNQNILTNSLSIIDISSYFSPISGGNSYFFNLIFLRDGTPIATNAGDFNELRLVFIPSSTSTTGKSSNYNTLDALYEKGIDPTDYYQVMKHFNLKH